MTGICIYLWQRSLATDLQNLSMDLRRKQSAYLKRLQQQQEVATINVWPNSKFFILSAYVLLFLFLYLFAIFVFCRIVALFSFFLFFYWYFIQVTLKSSMIGTAPVCIYNCVTDIYISV
jgi:Flp pilus assembly protein TadB